VALRDIALTVLELEPHEFHWVLMEAVQAASEDILEYRPIDSSTQGLPDYSEALIQGASALRVLQGLAPFGRPVTPSGIGESARVARPAVPPAAAPALPPATARDSGAATAAGSASASPRPSTDPDPDSCMFTTGRESL
jgi:hypothetical protein